MKKLITLSMLFIGLMVYSQTPFPNGFRLPTAGEKEPTTDSIRIITMDEYGIVNGWVTRNSLGNGGGGGATAWGFITGNLSNQTDLINALNSKQPINMTLTGLSGLSVISNDMIYGTGTDTFGTFQTTVGGRALLNVAGTMNTFPYYSAVNTVSLAPLTTYARSLLDDPDASTARITLGLHGVAATGNYNDLNNKPIIPAQFNPIAGTGISITGTYPNMTFTATGGASGTVTSVNNQSPDGSGNVELDSDDINEGATNLYFTSSERSKLSGIEAGAQVNVNADWNSTSGDSQILNKPTLSTVAISGDYNDLDNQPTIPAQVNLIEGSNVTITGTYPNLTINSTTSGGDSNTIESISRNGVSITPDGNKNVDIPIFSTSGAGLVPARVGSVATKYLREDGTWVTPTNTTYTTMSLAELQAGTATTARTMSAKNINDWLNGEISAVGFSGSYNDLTDKPTIPSTPNITQVLTAGNTIGGYFGTVMEFENPFNEDNFKIISDESLFIGTNPDNSIVIFDDYSINLKSTVALRLNNQTFPLTSGSNGQVLTTNGSGVMSWTTPSSGTTYTAGDGIDITSNEISLKQATDSEIGGIKVWKGTQEQYDALGTYDNNTLYYIETTPVKNREVLSINSIKGIALPSMTGSTPESITPIDLFDVCLTVDLDYIDWEITWKVGDTMYKASALGDYNLQLSWSPSHCFQLVGETMSDVEYIIGGAGSTDAKLILYY